MPFVGRAPEEDEMEAAKIPVTEEDPVADQHLRIMVESMLRAGRTEREIVAAVEEATSTHEC
jgi:hypothetical protein